MQTKVIVCVISIALIGCCVGQFNNNQNTGQFGTPTQFTGNNQQNTGTPGFTNQLTNQNFPANVNTQQGNFQPNQQGGFPQNQQGGFNNNQQQGGFQPAGQGTGFQQNNQIGGFPGTQPQPGGFNPNQQPAGFPGTQQTGAFRPNNQPTNRNLPFGMGRFQAGGFNTVGNNFGNPFVAGNSFGQNPFIRNGQDNSECILFRSRKHMY